VGVEEAAGAQALEDLLEAVVAEGEAAFGAAQLAVLGGDLGLGIPGAVDDDRPRLGIGVGLIEPGEAERAAIFAGIIIAGEIAAVRRGLRIDLVREALEPAAMIGIGAAPMGDIMAGDAAAGGIEQEETRLPRGAAEIGDADDVGVEKRGTVPVE